MQFSSLLVAAAAMAVANAVQFTMNASQFVSVKTGTPFEFSWSGASGPVTLTLKQGPASNLNTISVIQSGLTGTTYSWTPDSSIAAGAYAFEISDSTGTPNYSQQFTLASSTVATTSVSSSVSGTSTTASTLTSTSTGSSTVSGSTTSSSATSTSNSSSATGSTTTGSSSSGSSSSASKTTSKSGSTTTSAAATTSTTAAVNSASGFASPLALVLLAFAAIVTVN